MGTASSRLECNNELPILARHMAVVILLQSLPERNLVSVAPLTSRSLKDLVAGRGNFEQIESSHYRSCLGEDIPSFPVLAPLCRRGRLVWRGQYHRCLFMEAGVKNAYLSVSREALKRQCRVVKTSLLSA